MPICSATNNPYAMEEDKISPISSEDNASLCLEATDNAKMQPSEEIAEAAEQKACETDRRTALVCFKGADIVNTENTVIYDLSMEVFKGDFVYIVGKVGTGKTSIIRTMIAENPLIKGHGEVCGFTLEGIKDRDVPFLRRKVGVIFQDFQLLVDRSVEENLAFVLKATGWKDEEKISGRIAAVLGAVGMRNKAHKMPHQLSGGEQQRIAIARSLLNEPELILADEPTGNLDNETADGILRLLSAINKRGTAIVMVTHNRNIFEKYKGRVMVCKDEHCCEQKEDEVIDLALTI